MRVNAHFRSWESTAQPSVIYFMLAPKRFDEPERIGLLRAYQILDTEPEGAYDNIVRAAADLFQVPYALISLLEDERQWFKAKFGTDLCETPIGVSFCAHAICDRDVLVVPDTTKDIRFQDNELVLGPPGVRFYAGAPIIAPCGTPLGTLCVLDTVPQQPNDAHLHVLRILSDHVGSLFELRRLARNLLTQNSAFEALRLERGFSLEKPSESSAR